DRPPSPTRRSSDLTREEDLLKKAANGSRRSIAEKGRVNGLRRIEPDEEQGDQHGTDRGNRRERRRVPDVKSMAPGTFEAKFAPAAYLVKADGRKGADQSEARHERIGEMNRVRAG